MGWNLGYLNFLLLLLLLNPNLPYFYPLKVPFSLSPHTLFPPPLLFYFYLIVYFSQGCASNTAANILKNQSTNQLDLCLQHC